MTPAPVPTVRAVPPARVSSRKYRDASRGQPCTLRIAGVCRDERETTVFAHIRDRHTGKAIKASDTSGADACFACHAVFDGQAGEPLSEADWLFYALRGMQETLENRIARGIIVVPVDVVRPSKPKPRKPPEQRAKIAARAAAWPPKGSRQMRSRNDRPAPRVRDINADLEAGEP